MEKRERQTYGVESIMSEKRFECVFIEDDEFGGTFRRLKDNETGIMHMTCDVVDLLNFQNTQIKILKEENEQLQKEIKRLKCMNNQLEKRLDYSIAYDMEECE